MDKKFSVQNVLHSQSDIFDRKCNLLSKSNFIPH